MKKLSAIVLCVALIQCSKTENLNANQPTASVPVHPNDTQGIRKDSNPTILNEVGNKNDESSIGSELSVNEIAKLPADIHGCGSYLSANEFKFKSSKFNYVDNTQNAYMNLNGSVEKFDIVKHTQLETTLTNAKYNVKINSTKIGDLEEGMLLEGTIEIIAKENSHKKTVQFYGASGC